MFNEEPNTTTPTGTRRTSALKFGVRTAILAGLILAPPAMAVTGTAAALQPALLAEGHTTCCPPGED